MSVWFFSRFEVILREKNLDETIFIWFSTGLRFIKEEQEKKVRKQEKAASVN